MRSLVMLCYAADESNARRSREVLRTKIVKMTLVASKAMRNVNPSRPESRNMSDRLVAVSTGMLETRT